MPKTISQWMWGYQHTFRYWMESAAENAFSEIRVNLSPLSYLVGFRETGNGEWPICIEPETGPFNPNQFKDVIHLGNLKYKNHPQTAMQYSHRENHLRIHAALRDRCWADAIEEKLTGSYTLEDREFFVGSSSVVGDFRVFPVLSVLKSKWNSLPTLANKHEEANRFPVVSSFSAAVVLELLKSASEELGKLKPPVYEMETISKRNHFLVKNAAHNYVDRIVFNNANEFGSNFVRAMDAVAAQPYEGRTGIGTILLCKNESPGVVSEIGFESPVSTRDVRGFRKLLEMTGNNLHLLCDGYKIYGLGRIADDYDSSTESVFKVTVAGRGSWQIEHNSLPLLRIENGEARLPGERISHNKFKDTVTRIFPTANDADALWRMSQAAVRQTHGTMLVVHQNASSEAIRLAPQAIAITPTILDDTSLDSITAIDGAVLVDPQGRCHAVGVILDGVAISGAGDPSRGARFNSAIRYWHASQGKCLIIIVSEDGIIDLLPNLHRRVKSSEVEYSIKLLEEQAKEDTINFEEISRKVAHVESFAFYLSGNQCERVNAARQKVEDFRTDSDSAIKNVSFPILAPNADMNDSYFLPEV